MSKKVCFEDQVVSHIIEQEKLIKKQNEEIRNMEKELADLRRLAGVSNEVQQCAVTGYKFLYRLKTPATYECIPVEDKKILRQTCDEGDLSDEGDLNDDDNLSDVDNEICDEICNEAYERMCKLVT